MYIVIFSLQKVKITEKLYDITIKILTTACFILLKEDQFKYFIKFQNSLHNYRFTFWRM